MPASPKPYNYSKLLSSLTSSTNHHDDDDLLPTSSSSSTVHLRKPASTKLQQLRQQRKLQATTRTLCKSVTYTIAIVVSVLCIVHLSYTHYNEIDQLETHMVKQFNVWQQGADGLIARRNNAGVIDQSYVDNTENLLIAATQAENSVPVAATSCTPSDCDMHAAPPHQSYTFSTTVVYNHMEKSLSDYPLNGVQVTITPINECCRTRTDLPNAYFHIHAVGRTLAAAPFSVLVGQAHTSATAFIPLTDAGMYAINTKLMLYNVSNDMPTKNWQKLDVDDDEMGEWVYKNIMNDAEQPGEYTIVMIDLSIPHSDPNQRFAIAAHQQSLPADMGSNRTIPTSYFNGLGYYHYSLPEELNSKQPQPQWVNEQHWPLCGSHGYEEVRGSYSHWHLAEGTQFGPPLTVKSAEFHPYNCFQPMYGEIDGTVRDKRALDMNVNPLLQQIKKHRWVNFIGDSVTRHLFEHVCSAVGGTKNLPPAEYTHKIRHGPMLCNDASGEWAVTYSAWWNPVYIPWLESSSAFSDMCAKYNETDIDGQYNHWPQSGWPACTQQSESIRSMQHPGFSYVAWGSHPSNLGEAELRQYWHEFILNHPYIKQTPTLFGTTTAVNSGWIPEKFGRQAIMRNDERIHAANRIIMDLIAEAQANNKLKSLSPADEQSKDWLPVLDFYSQSHVNVELLNFDAVHFEAYFNAQMVAWFTNYLVNAPNFQVRDA